MLDTFLILCVLFVNKLSDYLDDSTDSEALNAVNVYLLYLIVYSVLAVLIAWILNSQFARFLRRIHEEDGIARVAPLISQNNDELENVNEPQRRVRPERTPSEQKAYEDERKKKIEKELNIPDFIYKQSATFFRRILPNREARLKKMFQASKKKKAAAVSISSRHLHSSIASSKLLLPFDPNYKN